MAKEKNKANEGEGGTSGTDAENAGDQANAASAAAPETPGANETAAEAAPQPAEPFSARFHYPVVKSYTGKIQYAINDAGATTVTNGLTVLRGEVVGAREKMAVGLVQNGRFSHVAATTPVGQPEQYKAGRKPAPAAGEGGAKPSAVSPTGGSEQPPAPSTTGTDEQK